jgi:hypothetical protein
MERCLDCNSLLATEEKNCTECGLTVAIEKTRPADLFLKATKILYYLSIGGLLAAIFVPEGPNLILSISLTCALLFIMRSAKDGCGPAKR